MAAAAQELRYNTSSLNLAFDHAQRRDTAFINDYQTLPENMVEYGTTLYGLGKDEQTSEMRNELIKLLKLKQEVAAHQRALQEVASTYRPNGLQTTDFKALIKEQMDKDEALQGYSPEGEQQLRDFDSNTVSAEQQAGPQEMGEDDDLIMEDTTGGFKNLTCPLSMKPLLEIQEPVEDPVGFIYEKSFFLDHYKRSMQSNGRCECPVHGTRHLIRLDQLKPSRRVAIEKRRIAAGLPSHLRPTQAAPADEVILDAD